MNLSHCLPALALVLASTPLSFAASTVDMQVQGMIIPNACNVSLSDNGTVDHGKISARTLKPTEFTLLPGERLGLSITCDAPVLFAMSGIDNRAESSWEPGTLYGLGHNIHAPTERLGSVALTLRGPVGDDAPMHSLVSSDDGANWSQATHISPRALMGFAPLDMALPQPIQHLVASLQVDTAISPANSLTLIEEVPLEGLITLDLKYL